MARMFDLLSDETVENRKDGRCGVKGGILPRR